jgi:hypothetical protein
MPVWVTVEQCCERAGRSSLRISIDALAVSPAAPHLFVTGGGDPIARLYDMRMLPGCGSSGSGAFGLVRRVAARGTTLNQGAGAEPRWA